MIPEQGRLPVPWPTAAVLAVALTYATGFWITALQGAVGATASAQDPFVNWSLHSTLMLPVFLVAVVVALVAAERRYGPPNNTARTLASAAAVTGVSTLVGIAQVAASTLYDYHLQIAEIESTRWSHFHAVLSGDLGTCDSTCVAEGLTLDADVRGVLLTAGVLLASNLVLVGWIVTMGGGRLTSRRPVLTEAGRAR